MELSIIITSYKNPELLKVCIDSIKRNYTGTDFEIIVADSATEEKTEMMMREEYPEITFFPSKQNIGFSRTVNAGLRAMQGEFALILNGDIIVKKNAIEKMLDFIKKNPSTGILGPQLLNFNETLQASCFHFYTPLTIIYRRTFLGKFDFAKKHIAWFTMQNADHKKTQEVDWIMGSSLMTSKKAIDKVGFMDDTFRLYFEDTDWCRRFWENGFQVIFFPEAQMYHYHGRGSVGKNVFQSLLLNKLTWIHIQSALIYFWKYAGKKNPRY
jgi:hypothetical protein